ncbi:hypothetical protein [Methylorubrum populi]|uniref:Uncharacterized protein n=1 Tax=Methylorubrum populi TaxID=223967 RepID=A0A921E5M2_9HYPH|nr:hypothetical protein [Methylorubrum populi]
MQAVSHVEFEGRLKTGAGAPRSGGGLIRLAVVGACALMLSACVSAKEQRAMDLGQCADFGFQPGTDAFAQCMMDVSQQREMMQQNRLLAQQAQLAARNREEESRRDLYRALSLQRTGDKNFPVCGASSAGGLDARNGTWYGPNCRAK